MDKPKVKELSTCLACGGYDLKVTLNLGDQPPANKLSENVLDEDLAFPLVLKTCQKCTHSQLSHIVDPDYLYKDYPYVSGTSQTMRDYMNWFAGFAIETYQLLQGNATKTNKVLDIGCNDGTQLTAFHKLGYDTFGVDPAENLEKERQRLLIKHKVYVDYFDATCVNKIMLNEKQFDIIVAQNVFAHNPNPIDFLRNAGKLMHDRSLLFIQTSQADMFLNGEFDSIYHEHISFYNINSMVELTHRSGTLSLLDMVKSPLHGNSYIFIIGKHSYPMIERLRNAHKMEAVTGLHNPKFYEGYATKIEIEKRAVNFILENHKDRPWIAYGAAAKATVMLNYFDLHPNVCIDENPLKQGKYIPGVKVPIVSPEYIGSLDPEAPVIWIVPAWNFMKEIREKIKAKRDNPDDLFLRYTPAVGYCWQK